MKIKKQSIWYMLGDGFTVEVRAWQWSKDEWVWNVYAHVFEGHRLFNNPSHLIDSAPLSGGCTFDKAEIRFPINGIRYEWQEIQRSYTVGSDYKHIWDDDYSQHGPELGMPLKIEGDAKELFEWLSSDGEDKSND